jgi:hypothetical protein
MSSNYLEQLVAEWFEYQGYFVRRNVLVGRRAKGGYECELDIVAFHPITKHLIHAEPSMDADSWSVRERRYRRKFMVGKKYIPALFEGLDIPVEIEQIAILVFASKSNHQTIGGGRVVIVQEILQEIFRKLRDRHLSSSAIPEHLIILRSFQFVTEYRKEINETWSGADSDGKGCTP